MTTPRFDFTALAYQVVSLPEIDGDPARPSPVHYKLYVDTDDSAEMKELDSIIAEMNLEEMKNNNTIEIEEVFTATVTSDTEHFDFEVIFE